MSTLHSSLKRRSALSCLTLLALLAAGATAHDDGESGGDLSIVTLSTRPSYVSGGDVLVRVGASRRVAPSDVEDRLHGADRTSALLPDASCDPLLGLDARL